MTLIEIGTLLKTTGFPVEYHHFKKPPKSIPYIIYLFSGSDNFGADDIVYQKSEEIQIELYYKEKKPSQEKTLEDVLDSAGLFYEKQEAYITSEEMYVMYYQITI